MCISICECPSLMTRDVSVQILQHLSTQLSGEGGDDDPNNIGAFLHQQDHIMYFPYYLCVARGWAELRKRGSACEDCPAAPTFGRQCLAHATLFYFTQYHIYVLIIPFQRPACIIVIISHRAEPAWLILRHLWGGRGTPWRKACWASSKRVCGWCGTWVCTGKG
jgi:hypothetical protein